MKCHLAALFCLLVGFAARAEATPTIVVGNYLVPNAAAVSIDIFVTGVGASPDSLSALDLWVSIGSEGGGSAGPAPLGEPTIVSVDVVTGTVYSGNSANPAPGQVLFSSDQVWEIGNITNSGVITNNGKLFTITINTSTMVPAMYPLRVLGVLPGLGPFDSNFSNDQVLAQTFLGSNGFFGSPEPSTFAIAAIGFLALTAWRARKGRR